MVALRGLFFLVALVLVSFAGHKGLVAYDESSKKLAQKEECENYIADSYGEGSLPLNKEKTNFYIACYYLLNKDKGNYPLSLLFSDALARMIYSEPFSEIDVQYVESSIKKVVEMDAVYNVMEGERHSLSAAHLIENLLVRWNSKIEEKILEARSDATLDATKSAFAFGGLSFLGTLAMSKKAVGGRYGLLLNSLINIAAPSSAFAVTYDIQKDGIFVEGAPPSPTHILKAHFENLPTYQDLSPVRFWNSMTTLGVFFGGGFLMEYGLRKYPWNFLAGKASRLKVVNHLKLQHQGKCAGPLKWIGDWSRAKSRVARWTYKPTAFLSNILHPTSVATAATFYLQSDNILHLTSYQSKLNYLSAVRKAQEKLDRALTMKNAIAVKVALENYHHAIDSYAHFLDQRLRAEYQRELNKLEEEGSEVDAEEAFSRAASSWWGLAGTQDWVDESLELVEMYQSWRLMDPSLKEMKIHEQSATEATRSLSRIHAPGRVYLWAAKFLKDRGFSDQLNRYYYQADRNALHLEYVFEKFEQINSSTENQ